MSSSPGGLCTRALDALQEVALSLGGLGEASRRAGRSTNYLSNVKARGELPFTSFCDLLERFEVDIHRFFRWATVPDDDDTVRAFGREALDIAIHGGEPPVVAQTRLAFLRGELDEIELAPESELHRLDERRFDEPDAAARGAEALLPQMDSVRGRARLLGIWASALRAIPAPALRWRRNQDMAQWLVWSALRLADAIGDDTIVGELLQRACYVTARRTGDFADAHAFARAAQRRFQRTGDRERIGRAHVDQGIMLRRKGDERAARIDFHKALDLLDSTSNRNRSAALSCLADGYASDGALTRADALADQAIQCAPTDVYATARLCWLRARIATANRRWPDADRWYGEAVQRLGDRSPTDSALAAAEWTRVLVHGGHLEQAQGLAWRMAWAVIPLESEVPAAAAALADLIAASATAERFSATAKTLARRLEQKLGDVAGHGLPKPKAAARDR